MIRPVYQRLYSYYADHLNLFLFSTLICVLPLGYERFLYEEGGIRTHTYRHLKTGPLPVWSLPRFRKQDVDGI